MKRVIQVFVILLIVPLGVGSCRFDNVHSSQNRNNVQSDAGYVRRSCNSVYYWKTVFTLSEEVRQWLTDHQIGRLYIRYFDIGTDLGHPDTAIPNATILFKDSVPSSMEIVPVVFIDNKIFYQCDMSTYPERIVRRILTMSETNEVRNIHEVQLDCDWTNTTEKTWFEFLESVKAELAKHQIILTVTIRLHQLNKPVPPADRGVLMCYNTGAVRSSKTGNSILDADDVSPYAKNLKSYTLPLDIAYPTFTWAVWFDMSGNFRSLLRNLDPENKNLEHREGNKYIVKNEFYQEGEYMFEGDVVRFEFSDYDEIMHTKKLLEPQLKNYSVILFHLDSNNLSKYASYEIDKIYNN